MGCESISFVEGCYKSGTPWSHMGCESISFVEGCYKSGTPRSHMGCESISFVEGCWVSNTYDTSPCLKTTAIPDRQWTREQSSHQRLKQRFSWSRLERQPWIWQHLEHTTSSQLLNQKSHSNLTQGPTMIKISFKDEIKWSINKYFFIKNIARQQKS